LHLYFTLTWHIPYFYPRFYSTHTRHFGTYLLTFWFTRTPHIPDDRPILLFTSEELCSSSMGGQKGTKAISVSRVEVAASQVVGRLWTHLGVFRRTWIPIWNCGSSRHQQHASWTPWRISLVVSSENSLIPQLTDNMHPRPSAHTNLFSARTRAVAAEPHVTCPNLMGLWNREPSVKFNPAADISSLEGKVSSLPPSRRNYN
jgi:hypothetical protein